MFDWKKEKEIDIHRKKEANFVPKISDFHIPTGQVMKLQTGFLSSVCIEFIIYKSRATKSVFQI